MTACAVATTEPEGAAFRQSRIASTASVASDPEHESTSNPQSHEQPQEPALHESQSSPVTNTGQFGKPISIALSQKTILHTCIAG